MGIDRRETARVGQDEMGTEQTGEKIGWEQDVDDGMGMHRTGTARMGTGMIRTNRMGTRRIGTQWHDHRTE